VGSYLDRSLRAARRWSRRCAFCRDSSRRWVRTCSGCSRAQRSGNNRASISGLASTVSCRITSCRYAQGSSRCRFAPARIVHSTAARGPAFSLPRPHRWERIETAVPFAILDGPFVSPGLIAGTRFGHSGLLSTLRCLFLSSGEGDHVDRGGRDGADGATGDAEPPSPNAVKDSLGVICGHWLVSRAPDFRRLERKSRK